MGYRYNLNDRILGGSMEPRLNPEIVDQRLNANLGPNRPRPLVRETNSGSIGENGNNRRRRLIGLPSRFDRE